MSTIVVDSSSIITCATNCLMWVFDEFSKRGTEFIVPIEVHKEVVESGISSQRFRLEALRVVHHFSIGTFKTLNYDIKKETEEVLSLANSSFFIRGNPLKILQKADAEVIVLAKKINADAIMTDERTLRMIIENPFGLKKYLQRKFHSGIKVDKRNLSELNDLVSGVPVLRSTEMMAVALEKGIFDLTINWAKQSGFGLKEVISGILYSTKFSGCAISFEELNTYVNLLMNKMRSRKWKRK